MQPPSSEPFRLSPRLRILRQAAALLGDGGAFVLAVAGFCAAALPVAWNHDLGHLALSVLLASACLACVVARRRAAAGLAILSRMSRPAAQTGEELRLRRRFGLRDDSDERTVKSDFALRMKAWHSDAGTGGVDMDEVKQARNRLFHLVAARRNPTPAAELVAAWRAAAGPLGGLWGRTFPTDALIGIHLDAGEAFPGVDDADRIGASDETPEIVK